MSNLFPITLLALFLLAGFGYAQHTQPNCDGKQGIVYLFEWKWTDVAQECERYLAGNNFCAALVSPPNEHAILRNYGYPWWQRYQPVSYKLASRSGTEAQFIDMVRRCNTAGVRIYVDAVLNHMTGSGGNGTGDAGSYYDTDNLIFTGVPYGAQDFTPCNLCSKPSCQLEDSGQSGSDWRNCYLYGLADLYGASDYVRGRMAAYLNTLIAIGVAGIRLDAAGNMWPTDIANVLGRLNDLPPSQGFLAGSKLFVFQSVPDLGNISVKVDEYFNTGYVTEFRFARNLYWALQDYSRFDNLVVDLSSGMARSDRALTFVDTHDTQRNDYNATSFKNPREYKQAVAYMMAVDYGLPMIMSSYDFENADVGPPQVEPGTYTTADVVVNPDGISCRGGWVCEHRWNVVKKMVRFRNAVRGTSMANYWNDGTAVAFSRGSRGFFAMAKNGMSQVLQTGLPPGEYSNIIDDGVTRVTVDSDGTATIRISNSAEPILALIVQ